MQYTEILLAVKTENFQLKNFDIFLCFRAKIREIDKPLLTPVLLYKSGVQGGTYVHYTDMLS